MEAGSHDQWWMLGCLKPHHTTHHHGHNPLWFGSLTSEVQYFSWWVVNDLYTCCTKVVSKSWPTLYCLFKATDMPEILETKQNQNPSPKICFKPRGFPRALQGSKHKIRHAVSCRRKQKTWCRKQTQFCWFNQQLHLTTNCWLPKSYFFFLQRQSSNLLTDVFQHS